MKKIICMVLALAMVPGLAGCGGASAPAARDSINVCIASEPDTIDPALCTTIDGATLDSHLFAGLARWDLDENGSVILAPDCAAALPEGVINGDGTVTYTYTLRDGLKWSDGQALTAGDFEFAWKRAASTALGADYGYMFASIKGAPDDLAVEATDDRTLVVTLNNVTAYWNELLAFPAYFPVRQDVVANEGWASDPATFVSNGPYTLTGWNHNAVITLTRNENYFDADTITMRQINFYLSDDDNNMLSNFKNGDWQFIDSIPTNEMAAVKRAYPTAYRADPRLGIYYICWNVNQDILPAGSGLTDAEAEQARAEIRRAISLLLDRNYIVEQIGQAGQTPAPSFVTAGIRDADGSQFYENAGHNDGFPGYYDVSEDAYEGNFASAVETLKKYYDYDEASGTFTNFPTLTYLYNTAELHKGIAEYVSTAAASVGITMNLENQEWNTFLNTRKAGGYSVCRNAWVGDFNDPSTFLELFTSGSGNNDAQLGKGAHADVKAYSMDLTDLGYDVKVDGGTWAQTFDVICQLARTCTDSTVRYQLLHRAEDLLMSTGAAMPLYFYTDPYLIDDSVQGFFSTPMGFKFFKYCTIG